MTDYNVLIVGAGPAGLSAGATTAQAGLSTLIVEEHQELGRPLACGEGISVEKLLTLENMPKPDTKLEDSPLNLQQSTSYIERQIQIQRFFFGTSGVATANLHAVTINRPRFDKLLGKKAAKEGAGFLLGTQVTGLEPQNKTMKVHTTNGEYTANVVIGCDGPSAHTVQMLNLPKPSRYVQGVEYKVEGVHTDALDFYFDFKRFPKMHYGWVFPKRIHTNVGVTLDLGSRPRRILDEFVEYLPDENVKKSEVVEEIAGIIPAGGPIPKLHTDNFMAAGDAAGLTNSIFYGGIAIAIHSGMLAGQTTIEAHANNQFDESQLSSYHNKILAMDYTNPTITNAHDILYTKLTGNDLEDFGSLIDGWNITSLGALKKFLLILKALFRPRLFRKFKDARTVAQGFSISRDWGF